jgi:hypothetical protein
VIYWFTSGRVVKGCKIETNVDRSGLGSFREESGVQPGSADGPDHVTSEDDDEEPEEVDTKDLNIIYEREIRYPK